MRKIWSLFCLCSPLLVMAQVEIPRSEPVTIEPVRTETRSFDFSRGTEAPLLKRPEKKLRVNMLQQSDLITPGSDKKIAKFKKDAPRPEQMNNTYLGEVTTGSEFMKFICRDHMYQDGDKVRVIVDGVTMIEEIYLTNAWKGFDLDLKEGFNKIEIQALNQGASGPNTAAFKVFDDKGEELTSNVWNLYTGITATLIVIKEGPSKTDASNSSASAGSNDQ